jgi:DNA-binding transcriptional ArsR family regulator
MGMGTLWSVGVTRCHERVGVSVKYAIDRIFCSSHIPTVLSDRLSAVAEPLRQRILAELLAGDRCVNDLVRVLGAPQPTVSKHLKVLRECGFVSCRAAATQRIYHLEPGPLRDLDAWLAPYRRLWTVHLDALARHLDRHEP